jgi:hypothetical protein
LGSARTSSIASFFDLGRIEKQLSRMSPVRRALPAFREAKDHVASIG